MDMLRKLKLSVFSVRLSVLSNKCTALENPHRKNRNSYSIKLASFGHTLLNLVENPHKKNEKSYSIKIYLIGLFLFLYTGVFFHTGTCQTVWAANLEYTVNLSGVSGAEVTVTLKIINAPNDVDALGLDIKFDPNALQYIKYEKGDLVQGSLLFDVSNPESGLLRIGEINLEDNKIAQGTSGTIVDLYFTLRTDFLSTIIQLDNMVDDIDGWSEGSFGIDAVSSDIPDNDNPAADISLDIDDTFFKFESGSCFINNLL